MRRTTATAASLEQQAAAIRATTLLGPCDVCLQHRIAREATAEATVGGVWLSVCDVHAYRLRGAS